MPRWNRTAGGQEVAVCIRMDVGPRSPGLRVVHSDRCTDDADTYGPYLGGWQVRLAVAALHRVVPLAYAGTGLRGAEVEMARLRGITSTDRPSLVARLTDALRREPIAVAWVRAELETLRERASERLAFELAARIDAELRAFAWIASPQRVTTRADSNAQAYGWCSGLLVRYDIRAGRLSGWTQRACGPARLDQLRQNRRRRLKPSGTEPRCRFAELLSCGLLSGSTTRRHMSKRSASSANARNDEVFDWMQSIVSVAACYATFRLQ